MILFYILNNQEVYIFYTHTHTERYAEKEKHKTTSDEAKIVRRIRALTGKKGRELSVAERDASFKFFFFFNASSASLVYNLFTPLCARLLHCACVLVTAQFVSV